MLKPFGAANTSTLQTPKHLFTTNGSYDVKLVASDGSNTDSITRTVIIIDCSMVLFIPNAFTPNGDNVNDEFMARGENISDFLLIIYDRWGEKVFESTNFDEGWDGTFKGKPLSSAVFAYYLKATFLDLSGEREIEQTGNITLLR